MYSNKGRLHIYIYIYTIINNKVVPRLMFTEKVQSKPMLKTNKKNMSNTNHINIITSFASDRLAIAVNYWNKTLLAHDINNNCQTISWRPYGNIVEHIKSFMANCQYNVNKHQCSTIILFRIEDIVYTHPEIVLNNNNDTNGDDAKNEKISWDNKVNEFIQIVKQCYCNNKNLDSIITAPLFLYICPSSPFVKHNALIEKMENKIRNHLENKYHLIHTLPKNLFSMFNLFPTIFRNNNKMNHMWYDLNSDTTLHAPLKPIASLALGQLCTRIVKRCQNRFTTRKVIILDCDNTLWGSSVSEVGVNNIILSKEYLWLQSFFTNLQKMGFLLCLCSKNNEEDVLNVFKNRSTDMVLNIYEHIVHYRINWNSKLHNMKELSNELQLSLDSFIFVDDNSGECEYIRKCCPDIAVVQIPKNPKDIPLSLMHSWVFDRPVPLGSIPTTEDKFRTERYRDSAKRQLAIKERMIGRSSNSLKEKLAKNQNTTTTAIEYDAIISSLAVKVQFENFAGSNKNNLMEEKLPRMKQLIERTNQFNATGKRALSTSEFLKYMDNGDDKKYSALVSVTDRFGHYGDVGLILYSILINSDESCKILMVDTLLLSCRALQRGVEYKMLKYLGEKAENEYDCKYIHIPFVKMPRNNPMKRFLESVKNVKFIKETNIYQINTESAITCSLTDTGINADNTKQNVNKLLGKSNNAKEANIIKNRKLNCKTKIYMNNLNMLNSSTFSNMKSIADKVYASSKNEGNNNNTNVNRLDKISASPLKTLMKTLEDKGANARVRGDIRNEVKDIFGNKKFLGDKKRKSSQAFSSISNARGKQVSKNIELNRKQKEEKMARAKYWKEKNGIA